LPFILRLLTLFSMQGFDASVDTMAEQRLAVLRDTFLHELIIIQLVNDLVKEDGTLYSPLAYPVLLLAVLSCCLRFPL
jgi:hypothetical protein